MPNYSFFFSYARLDLEDDRVGYIRTFYEDLEAEVRSQTGGTGERRGFFDGKTIEPGAEWTDSLRDGLRKSEALVCLYSPTYFNREYCGKEVQAFLSRLENYIATAKSNGKEIKQPRLIQPVLWQRPGRLPSPLPKALSHIQFTHDDYPDIYKQEGLRYIMNLDKHKDDYKLFKNRFAVKLITAIEEHLLPGNDHLPELKAIPSAFKSPDALPIDPGLPPEEGGKGPRYAQFVFIAGPKNVMQQIRNTITCYGDEGGRDWRPFLPTIEEEVGLFAQTIASLEKLHYDWIPVDGVLIQKLREAEQRNRIVILIVDPWSVEITSYKEFLEQYDSQNFANCSVLVPWNSNDQETSQANNTLQDRVHATLSRTLFSPFFRDSINSAEGLRTEIGRALREIQQRVIRRTEVHRRVQSSGPIPQINGPGRGSA